MRRWVVAASLVLVACGARSGIVPGVGGASGASGGASGGTLATGGGGGTPATGGSGGIPATGGSGGTPATGGGGGFDGGGATGPDAGGADSGSCSPTIFAQSPSYTSNIYGGLAVDADNVYWFQYAAARWLEIKPKAGGPTKKLYAGGPPFPDDPGGLVSSGPDIFFTELDGVHDGVFRVDKTTSKVSSLAGNVAFVVAANATTVFFVADSLDFHREELDMVPRAGGKVTTLSSYALTAFESGLVADSTHVYWIKPGQPPTLEALDPTLATPPKTLATGDFLDGHQTLALDGNRLFFLEKNGSTAPNGGVDVKSVSTAGGPSETVVSNTNAARVIADSGQVYFRSHGTYLPNGGGAYAHDGTIKRVPATGGAPVTRASGLDGGTVFAVRALAVDATYVYWIGHPDTFGLSILRTCR